MKSQPMAFLLYDEGLAAPSESRDNGEASGGERLGGLPLSNAVCHLS